MPGWLINFFIGVGLSILSAALRPKPPTPKAADIEDIKVPITTEGLELGKVYGSVWLRAPQFADYGDFRAVAIVEVGGRRYGIVGPRQRTTIGYRYFFGAHVVLCQSPIDSISNISFEDKVAWEGIASDSTVIINKPTLFGDARREGGVSGYIDVEAGYPEQDVNAYLRDNLRAGQLMPAFRGVFALVFKQFYWGNSAYVLAMRIKAHNIFNTWQNWLPGKAPIGGEYNFTRTAIHLALDCSTSMAGDKFVTQINAAKAFVADLVGFEGVSVRIQPFGTNGFGSIERLQVDSSDVTALQSFLDGLSATASNTNYDVGILGAEAFFNAAADALGAEGDAIEFASAASGVGQVGVATVSTSMRRVMVFMSDGAATGTTADDAQADIAALSGSVEVYAIGIDEDADISFGSGATSGAIFISFSDDLEKIDNTPQDGIPVISGTDEAELLSILSNGFSQFVDINPIHILRDVLIAPTSDGSGDAAEIGSSFLTAAQTIFAEGLGVSLFWQNPSNKDQFKALIEQHISGKVYRDRATGTWEVKLIRPDYDVGTLFTFDNTLIDEWIDYERPQQSELPNAVNLIFTRRDNGEDASITLHNVTAVAVTGRVNAEKVELRGITNENLANKICQRELMARTLPFASGTISVAYAPPDLNIGDAFIIDEPRMGINEMVCRVMEFEESDISNTSVLIRFVEDTFGADLTNDAISGGDSGDRPVTTPQAADAVFFEELAYYEQYQSRDAEIDDRLTVDPGFGNWQMTAVAPNSSHYEGTIVRLDGSNLWINVASAPLIPGWQILSDLTRAADETTFSCDITGREADLEVGQIIQIGTERMRLDSVVIASGVATFTVGRGCLDTVPQDHAADSYVLAWPGFVGSDDVDYTDTDQVTTRILTRTPQGQLSLGSATDNDLTFASRAFRPLPVGQLQVESSYLPSGILSGTVTVTWAHRDRLIQTTLSISDHTAGDIGPEDGVSYILVRRLIDLISGVETVSHSVEEPISPPQATTIDVDLDDAAFSAYAGADTIAMEIGIKTVREDSPEYENWQTPFVRFETAFANGASASSSVTPSPLTPPAGAVHWYDFSDSANYTESSGEITAATDLGSAGTTLTSAATKYPAVGAINGVPAADFDGSNDILKNTDGLANAFDSDTAAYTIFVVFQYDVTPFAAGTPGATTGMANYGATDPYAALIGSSGANNFMFYLRFADASDVILSGPTQDTDPHVMAIRMRADDTADLFFDGVKVVDNQSFSGSRLMNRHISIGARSSNVSTETWFMNGKVGETLWYSGASSDADVDQTFDYLMAKWGIS